MVAPFGSILLLFILLDSVINCKHIANRDIKSYCGFGAFIRSMKDEAESSKYTVGGRVG